MKDGTSIQVVGIVEDRKYTANLAEDSKAAMFLPILQSPSNDAWIVVRSGRDQEQLAAAIREQLRNLDPGLPVFMQTWNQEMSGALFAPRIAALSLGVLGLMGAVLSAIVYQATPRDPLALAGVVLAMALLGLTASWIPAQRILSLDPVILLREE